MAESFNNKLTSSAGIVTTTTVASIGAGATTISGISTSGISVGDMVDATFFRGATKVYSIGTGSVLVDKSSINNSIAANQAVTFMGVTTAYTASNKAILVGGTFANLTGNSVNLFVEIGIGNTFANIANDIPVPTGSSFVISDAGKTILRPNEEIRVYCDTENALDVSLSILEGVA
jgi:hypothetical protein